MSQSFFEQPVLNSPYEWPARHWELEGGQPTGNVVARRRDCSYLTPIPKSKKQAKSDDQTGYLPGMGPQVDGQEYDPTSIVNEVRSYVETWRSLPQRQWQVTPETARLLRHWRSHPFASIRPFFCQIEAAETAIWLAEVAPKSGERGHKFTRYLEAANAEAGGKITDQDLLREVMNTVGKKDQLGESIRCVVSVAMLTEGWDANTVTHILGVRAFGTQLLCEQVVGRGLRRQSYELNADDRFDVEYADVLGIPFDFTAKPVVAPPKPPPRTTRVFAVRPERDALEIGFPRVEGYRVELPDRRLSAAFGDDHTLVLTPDRACNRIQAAINEHPSSEKRILAILDAYNPMGSTAHVSFTTSRESLWNTDPTRCHINHAGSFGRWSFAEMRDVYALETDLEATISAELASVIAENLDPPAATAG